jgi:hypothetical protein
VFLGELSLGIEPISVPVWAEPSRGIVQREGVIRFCEVLVLACLDVDGCGSPFVGAIDSFTGEPAFGVLSAGGTKSPIAEHLLDALRADGSNNVSPDLAKIAADAAPSALAMRIALCHDNMISCYARLTDRAE